MRSLVAVVCLVCGCLTYVMSNRAADQKPAKEPFAGVLDEHPAIRYETEPTHDAVARLREAIASGVTSLTYRERGGYLHALLRALDVSGESQVLIFSKTGIQRRATSPHNPRALYFNDHTIVGYIAGARFIEVAAQDARQGIVFYTVDQQAPAASIASARDAGPVITRPTNCVVCHVSGNTLEVPGLITRSMITAPDGDVMPQLGSYNVDHRTPLAQRWGGWFVTGADDVAREIAIPHLGNTTTTVDATTGATAASSEVLAEWSKSHPESRGYFSSQSNIAALMLFDHQMHAMNLVTRVGWETRVAAGDGELTFTAGPLKQLVEELVDYFLFVDEVPLPKRLVPRRAFAEQFQAPGPRDRRGRSLRELDLEQRLFRYRCSYMIDSAAFANLPAPARAAIYRRMGEVLSGRASGEKYGRLSIADRSAVIDILRDTRVDLPDDFPPALAR